MEIKTRSDIKTTITSGILIGCVVFLFFAARVRDWRFFDDDYGAIFFSQTLKNASDIDTVLLKNHNDKTIMPSNISKTYTPNFSTTTLRPLTLYFYYFTAKIIDPHKPFLYFLFSCILHALATMLLFFIYKQFLENHLAIFAALLFGLFPFNGKFIGRIVIAPYSLSLILHFCAVLLLLSSRKNKYWIAVTKKTTATILFTATLFLHEINLSSILLYIFLMIPEDYVVSQKKLQQWFYSALPYIFCLTLYFFIKYLVYPINYAPGNSFLSELIHKMSYRFYDFVTMVVDILGYSFIPSGHKILKIGLILSDCLALSFLIFSQKKTSLYFVAALTILCLTQSWPSLLVMHVSRYLYFVLPYFLLLVFFCYQNLKSKHKSEPPIKLLHLKYLVLIIAGVIFIQKDLLYCSKKFAFTDDAIKQFAESLNTNSDLCFIGLPFDYFPVSGLAQAVWFYTKDFSSKRNIYYDALHAVRFFYIDFLPEEDEFSEIKLSKNPEFVTLKTNANQEAHVLIKNPFDLKIQYSLGSFEVLHTFDEKSKADEIKFFISTKYNPHEFVTWCNKNQRLELVVPKEVNLLMNPPTP